MLHIKTTDNNCLKRISEISKDVRKNNSDFEKIFLDSHYDELSRIANVPLKELTEKNKNLLVFPMDIEKSNGKIGELSVFEMYGSPENPVELKIKTGNLMGFIGSGKTQIEITSRFANGEKDNFLHYMLSKVFGVNLFNLNYDASGGKVFDLLIFTFPFVLKSAMTQGLFKTYKTFERNDANVKGVVNVPYHIRQNIPFEGKIAYLERAQTFDNSLTELVRHTIEFIKTKPFGKAVLNCDSDTKSAVSQIIEATESYSLHTRQKIISRNLRRTNHPFFTKWRPLQKLCLNILNHSKINYHINDRSVCGLLFDGAWLWEEYMNTILSPLGFIHPENKTHAGGIQMFENPTDEYEETVRNYRRIYPDFYKSGKFILDAKYKHLEKGVCREDLYQVISYMHTMKIPDGDFIFPASEKFYKKYLLANKTGTIWAVGVEIPQGEMEGEEFCKKMKDEEERITRKIDFV